MHIRRLTPVVGLAMVLAVAPSMAQSVPDVPRLFDMANNGQLDDAVRQAVMSFADVRDLDRGIRREAPAWIVRESTAAAPHRRLVVATFVLALARDVYQEIEKQLADRNRLPASLNPIAGLTDEGRAAWPRLRPLLEWACSLVRSSPTPFEHDWFVASVYLFKDFGDTDEAVVQEPGVARLYGAPSGHLAHALRRFPDDPWLRLILTERQTKQERGLVEPSQWPLSNSAVADLREARQRFLALESEASVRPHVHEHLGRIAAAFGELDNARHYFVQMADETQSPCLKYMGHLLTALIDDRQGQFGEAEAGYRRALGVFPRAGSASTALAALLWVDGRTTEATAFVRETRSPVPPADDPWMTSYSDFECSDWASLMAPLRAGLR